MDQCFKKNMIVADAQMQLNRHAQMFHPKGEQIRPQRISHRNRKHQVSGLATPLHHCFTEGMAYLITFQGVQSS